MNSNELISRQIELSAAVYAAQQDRDEDGCPSQQNIAAAEAALIAFEEKHPEIHELLRRAAA